MMDSDDIIAESSFMPPQALTLAPTQVSDAGNQGPSMRVANNGLSGDCPQVQGSPYYGAFRTFLADLWERLRRIKRMLLRTDSHVRQNTIRSERNEKRLHDLERRIERCEGIEMQPRSSIQESPGLIGSISP